MSRFSEWWKRSFNKKAVGKLFPSTNFKFINGQFVGITDNRSSYITEGYEINDIIYSCVRLVTDKCKMPEWAVYKIKDEQKFKQYLSITRKKELTSLDYKKSLQLKAESLELVNAGKLSEQLKYPNDHETMQRFVEKHIGTKMLTGGSCIWANILSAGANAGKPYDFHLMPYQNVTIVAQTKDFPITEQGYRLDFSTTDFTKVSVLHDKYPNYNYQPDGSHLYGMSPLKSALRRLGRSNSAVKSSAALFENQGIKGILSIDDPRVFQMNINPAQTTEQMQAIKEKMTTGEWVGADNAGRMAWSGYGVKWTDVGLKLADMQLLESEKWDLKRFCSIYNVPSPLLGDSDQSTYNNLKESETALTARGAMPLLNDLRAELNRKVNGDWGYANLGYFVDYDQTCFTEMQEDISAKAAWVNTMRGVSPNWKLNQLGLETVDNPIMDEPWITPDMGMPLSEWLMQDDGSADDKDGL